MSRSDKIIAAALGWVGTPYHHQARVRNVGVDCAQLVAAVAEEAGLIPAGTQIPNNYSPEWHLHNREEVLLTTLEFFGCKRQDKALPGDIVCFRYGRAVGHLGILVAEDQIVHAAIQARKVVLNTLNEDLSKRIAFVYSFPYPNTFSYQDII
jgi:NlpC/P60 family putative phage cell wall peptidase